MAETIKCDICVIGAGSAGLSVAAGAAQLGARTVLFERDEMGGDCLNTGCVPSKALLAAAHAAQGVRDTTRFGLAATEPGVHFPSVMSHVRDVIAAIAPNDSVARFEGLGVRVIKAEARFVDGREVVGGAVRVRARRFVIATGSTASVPSIPGIGDVAFLTNETIFSLDALPRHLIVLGGGPVGVELAQAFRRLGSRVTLIEAARLLSKDEPEFVEIVRRQLITEGVEVREQAKVSEIRRSENGVDLILEAAERVAGTHLLVATGRRPRLKDLDLEKAGVASTPTGVAVDARLRTTNRRIFALGDVAGGPLFTHVAGYHAGIIVRNALFRIPARVDYRALPRVTYTDPELAHAGLTEAGARARFGESIRVVRAQFGANDRAQTEHETAGGIKVIVRNDGRLLGASIVGQNAGELISLWVLAIARGLKLSAMTAVIFPYPTRGEISKAAASAFYAPRLFSTWPRRLVRLLALFG
jgi:pyruvate/2-oxoglutarate dehydrogenase complex dihydrolipoamide dehydrogenase (E3) component